jgi:hypothetical protein
MALAHPRQRYSREGQHSLSFDGSYAGSNVCDAATSSGGRSSTPALWRAALDLSAAQPWRRVGCEDAQPQRQANSGVHGDGRVRGALCSTIAR